MWYVTRTMRMVLPVAMLVIGGIGTFGSAVQAIPAWRAAHGQGRVGAFTLTEPQSCDRYAPPKRRCGWFGDFVSSDGTEVFHRRELGGGLPPGGKAGDQVPARNGGWSQIYQLSDRHAWKKPATFLAVFAGVFVAGLILVRPWRLVRRRRVEA
jgi:hypothetical protein